jgi:predicted PurR-regulated permease PerM
MTDQLARALKILLLLVLLVVILVYARPFLVPLTFAALIAMLLLPLSLWFEKKGFNRGLAVFFSILLFMVLVGGILSALWWQLSEIASNSGEIEKNLDAKVTELERYISKKFGVSIRRQEEIIKEQQANGGGVSSFISQVVMSLGGFLANMLLTLVYTFLFLYFRQHLNKFMLMLVPVSRRGKAQAIAGDAKGVAQKYITGLSWMILCLWIMYSIGFSIVGVEYAVLFAVLCGLLEIIPFVGNLTGNIITVLAVLVQGGSGGMIIGVLATYAAVQFIQTYLLEPLVVGSGVNINPLFTIAGIVAGELVWGIPGMILAIPLLGIAKIICDHVESLKPYGFLIGEEKKSKKGVVEKIKRVFKR